MPSNTETARFLTPSGITLLRTSVIHIDTKTDPAMLTSPLIPLRISVCFIVLSIFCMASLGKSLLIRLGPASVSNAVLIVCILFEEDSM